MRLSQVLKETQPRYCSRLDKICSEIILTVVHTAFTTFRKIQIIPQKKVQHCWYARSWGTYTQVIFAIKWVIRQLHAATLRALHLARFSTVASLICSASLNVASNLSAAISVQKEELAMTLCNGNSACILLSYLTLCMNAASGRIIFAALLPLTSSLVQTFPLELPQSNLHRC